MEISAEQLIKQDKEDISNMFNGVARRYDLANDVMSLGLHRYWKRRLVNTIFIADGYDVYDFCSGTGDIALLLSKKYDDQISLNCIDFSNQMLELAKFKVGSDTANYIYSDVTNLPFKDESADVLIVSFGLRNINDLDGAIAEIYRILKNGAKAYILEFMNIRPSVFNWPLRFYINKISPLLGRLVTGLKESYKYLPYSIEKYPNLEEVSDKLINAGFKKIDCLRLFPGNVSIQIAIK
ncbi:MAG: ubiquinone/menaquinone biosynthesis methyltransferase [Actinobacteria bacterium]|nr:ubiquinone/menaquinone biosynthesis methyltransferase [Actinomycetota bacterium]